MARYEKQEKKDFVRKNEQIRVPQVRLIDSDGTMLGVKSVTEALYLAKQQELDLVEISPTAEPPVCKILDYSKYLYEQGKKLKDAKKKTAKTAMKELRIKSRIASHDLEVKIKHIEDFLKRKDMVRLVVVFHGRENQHRDLGEQMLHDVAKRLEPIANVEGGLQVTGNRMSMIFVPKN
ncbi:Translation initiation factor IF-3 [Elusimicrobium minutum Pei191]|uniref:Translation initiation factor IF-3 n=1 Tax=Elusimicrobium minutum (strain Pei191) TaxID=445932 RepID=IF3_ELUMP|nr:translation initiation factor IF-3 [Elusimicrobium minutum]B2KB83.1 RecName: Full=Translation initiation factor IF-3 [Elusimicrobium minutum Pei191]ACC97905.1 Translation initiation factor IF-3 [Elusimicrobium minutum Pei191]